MSYLTHYIKLFEHYKDLKHNKLIINNFYTTILEKSFLQNKRTFAKNEK